MRNQYKILAEKYVIIKENNIGKSHYRGSNLRCENLFDYFKDKPGFNFFVQWLSIVDFDNPKEHVPDYNSQEQIDNFFTDWLDITYDNYIDIVMDQNESDDTDSSIIVEVEDEAEDRTSDRALGFYAQFKNDPNSEQYKAWKAYEAAQEEIKNASDKANANLDI
jgi:hypothetical protein